MNRIARILTDLYPGREGSRGAFADLGVRLTIIPAHIAIRVIMTVTAPLCTNTQVCLDGRWEWSLMGEPTKDREQILTLANQLRQYSTP